MLAPTRCEPALLPSQTAAHLFIRLTADRCWRLPPGHPEGRHRPRLYLARSCDGGISLSMSYQDINQSIPALRMKCGTQSDRQPTFYPTPSLFSQSGSIPTKTLFESPQPSGSRSLFLSVHDHVCVANLVVRAFLPYFLFVSAWSSVILSFMVLSHLLTIIFL